MYLYFNDIVNLLSILFQSCHFLMNFVHKHCTLLWRTDHIYSSIIMIFFLSLVTKFVVQTSLHRDIKNNKPEKYWKLNLESNFRKYTYLHIICTVFYQYYICVTCYVWIVYRCITGGKSFSLLFYFILLFVRPPLYHTLLWRGPLNLRCCDRAVSVGIRHRFVVLFVWCFAGDNCLLSVSGWERVCVEREWTIKLI